MTKALCADLPVVRLGDPSQAAVGDWVLAIGSPFGFEATNLRRDSSRPFVVSPELVEGSNHERLNRPLFDCSTGSQLRANG